MSALNLLRESVHRRAMRRAFTIRGGTDRLPRALAARLADRIHYGAPVTRIEHTDRSVAVVCGRDGARRTFTGDHLVCAIPYSVLRRLDVAPAFSRDKHTAIEQLEYTSVTRVFVQARRRFWIDDGFSGGASTDLPVMSLSDRSINQPGTRGILESYLIGAEARKAAARSERDRIDTAIAGMRTLFPAFGEHAEGGASHCWDEEEWTRGAYAWFRPGQMTKLLPHLARAEGRVHFAGEHASSQPGWMEGAIESGERVAREIIEASQ